MGKIFSSLNDFLKYISSHKVWAFATTVFVASFWFSINTYVNAQNEWLELKQRKSDLDRIELEWAVIDAIHGHVIDALETTAKADETYLEFRKEVTKENKIPERAIVLDYYTKIMGLNHDITRSIGNLDSLRSNNDVIDGYAKEFSADLKQYQVTFDEMENVFVAVLEGDNSAAFEHAIAQTKSMIQMPIYLEKTMNRFQGFEAEIDKIFKNAQSEQEMLINDTDLLFNRIYLAVAATIYMVIFGIVASRQWYLYARRKRVQSSAARRKNRNHK